MKRMRERKSVRGRAEGAVESRKRERRDKEREGIKIEKEREEEEVRRESEKKEAAFSSSLPLSSSQATLRLGVLSLF